MKAVLCKTLGPARDLVLEEVASPVPKKNEILLEVQAAGVNFPDTSSKANTSSSRRYRFRRVQRPPV